MNLIRTLVYVPLLKFRQYIISVYFNCHMKHPRYNHLDIIDKDQQKKSEIALWFTIFMTIHNSYWMSAISQILHPTRNLYS